MISSAHAKAHVVIVAVISTVSALSAASVALFLRDDAPPASAAASAAAAATGVDVVREHPKDVVGLWTRWPNAKSDGDRVRFYFFHEKGIGLYRYGKIGLNTTSSFDWHVDTNADGKRELVMTFRKTGEVKRTPYEVADGAGKPKSLVMTRDPKEPLVGAMAYTYVPPPAFDAFAPDLVDAHALADGIDRGNDGVGGRMWIDDVTFATGGKQFAIYQLKDTSIDGRGVGWHHVGDYDDWSTEALSYRYAPSTCMHDAAIDLYFNVRDERASSPVLRGALLDSGDSGDSDGVTELPDLTLVEDPRSFGHVRRYKDGGRSFAFGLN
jgi:hypothetical protein